MIFKLFFWKEAAMHGPAVWVIPVFIPSQFYKLNNLFVFSHFIIFFIFCLEL